MSLQPLSLTLLALSSFYNAVRKKRPIKMDHVVAELFEKHAVDMRSRRIIYARTMDVIRRWAWADTVVRQQLDRRCPEKMHVALMLGAVELAYPPRPAHTTINCITNWAKNEHAKFGSMVYGVLKALERNMPSLDARHCPEWVYAKLCYPQEITESIIQSWLAPPTLYIRIHPWNISKESFTSHLLQNNICFEVTDYGWIITQAIAIKDIPGYTEGWFYVQDAHAAAIDIWFASLRGTLWDACAAPGGKTLSALAFRDIQLTASDSNAKRFRVLQENIARARPPNSPPLQLWDASVPQISGRVWDAILLDVPCSGSGQMHKHPEKKWLLQDEALQKLLETQALLLHTAWDQLKDGGEMLYVTCSLFECENSQQVTHFLAHHPDATTSPLPLPGLPDLYGTTLLPNATGAGGFYLCRFLKKSHSTQQ